jgi:hypothetical protein
MKIQRETITIVTEAEWHVYEILRDLPVYLRFGIEVPPPTSLPKVLADRLYRRWWAQTYFLQIASQSLKSFVNNRLNKNRDEVRRKTARRGWTTDIAESGGVLEPMDFAPERRQSFADLFGPRKSEVRGNGGVIIWEFSQQTFNRLGALLQSISMDEHSSDVISSAQLRTIDTRTIAALCAYGEPLSDLDDVMSLIAAIILFLPEHARDLLCDKFLPDFQLTCKIKRLDGTLTPPLDLECLRPAGVH